MYMSNCVLTYMNNQNNWISICVCVFTRLYVYVSVYTWMYIMGNYMDDLHFGPVIQFDFLDYVASAFSDNVVVQKWF